MSSGGSRSGTNFITFMIRWHNSIKVNVIKIISIDSILFNLNRMTLKIIEPIRDYLKVFNSADEFNIWYTKNKDEVDTLTTNRLNKLYKINGYRITKIKGVLMLKKSSETNNVQQQSVNSPLVPEDLHELQEEIKNIKATVNKIIEYLNGTQQHMEVSPPSTTLTNM